MMIGGSAVSKSPYGTRRQSTAVSSAFAVLYQVLQGFHGCVSRCIAPTALLSSFSTRPTAAQQSNDASCGPTRKREKSHGYICFSAQDWWYHNRAHSDFQLMRRIAQRRRVLFVNSIGMRMPTPSRSSNAGRRIVRKIRSISKLIRQPDPSLPNFYVFTPLILPFYGFASLRQFNAALVRAQVTAACLLLGIIRPAVVVTIPTAWPVVRKMKYRAMVYNRSDRHSTFPEADRRYIAQLERELLSNADAVGYVSRSLLAEEQPLVRGKAFFLDHGVDTELFAPADDPPPNEFAALSGPIIGFFGGLDDYVIDFDLLERVARDLPHANLVLVGDATCSMERLTRLNNVRWIGFRPYEDIPSYGRAFDVAIMPWLNNEWIAYCNPIKLKEYLALGLPVVSTYFDEVEHYRNWVDVATDAADFVAAIERVFNGCERSTRAQRRAAVSEQSWDKSADLLVAHTEALSDAKIGRS